MDATLNTQEDNIQNVLSAMMNDLPEDCMREGLEGSYSYTGQTPKHKLKVTHGRKRKFDEEPEGKKDADNGEGISPRHDSHFLKFMWEDEQAVVLTYIILM